MVDPSFEIELKKIEEEMKDTSRSRIDAVAYAADLDILNVNRWRHYEDRNKKIGSVSGTAENLDLEQLEPGWIYVVNNICAYEATAGSPQIKIGFVREHQFHRLTSQTVALAENSVDYVGQVILREGDKIRARFENATTTDTIYLFANGYKIRR